MHDPKVIAEHYRQAEASFLLEGLDSSGDLQYQAMKARVVAGEIDIDEAIRQTVEHFKAVGRATAPELIAAK